MALDRSASKSAGARTRAFRVLRPRFAGARIAVLDLNLAFSAAALAAAPFFLAFVGLPTPAEAAIFTLALVPLIAAVTAARAGRTVVAHGMSAAAFAGIGLIIAFWAGNGPLAAYPWLVLAGLEAAASLDRRANALAIGFLTCAVGAIVAMQARVLPDESGTALASGLAVLVGLAKGPALARRFAQVRSSYARLSARNHAIAKALGDVIVVSGRDGLVETVSEESKTVFGAGVAEFLGRGLFEHVHVGDRPLFLQIISDAAHGDSTVTGRIRLRSKTLALSNGDRSEPRHLNIEMRAQRLPGKGDQPSAVVAILRDVTARERDTVSPDLPAMSAAGQDLPARGDALATSTHDLRTPLNAIIGFAEILSNQALQSADEGTRREYARTIHRSGLHLLSAIEAMLDAQRSEAADRLRSAHGHPCELPKAAERISEQRMKRFA